MPADSEIQLSKLISNLYTELFQRRATPENLILKKSTHNIEEVPLDEQLQSVLTTATNIYVWGPSGSSDMVDVSPTQGRWSECVWS